MRLDRVLTPALLYLPISSGRHREKRFIFSQFKDVKFVDVWNEAKSDKVVSYTIARDLTQVNSSWFQLLRNQWYLQYLAVQIMWITLHLLIWKGPATQLIGKEDSLVDKTFEENVDLSKIALFFMTPQTVARNLLVCTSFVSASSAIKLLSIWIFSYLSRPLFGSYLLFFGRNLSFSQSPKMILKSFFQQK